MYVANDFWHFFLAMKFLFIMNPERIKILKILRKMNSAQFV